MQEPDRVDGARVYLRQATREEALAVLDGRRPEHLLFADGYPDVATREVMEIFAGQRQAESTGFTPMFIVRQDDDAVIGDIGWSTPNGAVAPVVGYDVAEPWRGRGYATEALRLLIAHLFSRPEVERVCADTTMEHAASRRVMEKAGMRLVREAREEVDGEMQDVVHYEMTRTAAQAPGPA